MTRLVRGAVLALVAVLVTVVGALPASAAAAAIPPVAGAVPPATQPVYGCLDPVDGYGAPRACELLIEVLTPVCDNDVPRLTYAVNPVGTPRTTVTITFLNPDGPDVVYADQPLTGTVNWPGAVVGEGGRGVDWPGWTQLADGTWVQGDEFDWVRPEVQVLFAVNPQDTVTVAYPPSSPVCNTNPMIEVVLADNPSAAMLSATGSETRPLALVGGAVVLLGALAVAAVSIARARRPSV